MTFFSSGSFCTAMSPLAAVCGSGERIREGVKTTPRFLLSILFWSFCSCTLRRGREGGHYIEKEH